MKEWRKIHPNVVKLLTIGNHDAMAMKRTELSSILDCGRNPVIVGSPFNQSISFPHAEASTKFILVDTSLDADPAQWCYQGMIGKETLEWIGSELNNTKGATFLAMHHGPHKAFVKDPNSAGQGLTQFSKRSAQSLARLIDVKSKLGSPPIFPVLFGHEHGNHTKKIHDNLGPNLPGIQCPCAIDYYRGKFIKIVVQKGGSFDFFEKLI